MGNANINTSECQITGYDPNRAGRQTVTVSYQGKTATFNVNVVDLQSIRIASAPTKVTYGYGENLDLSGMRVIGTWPGLPEEAVSISSSNITGFNNQTVGRQTVTVTYRGKTATFNVEVVLTLNGTWVKRDNDGGELIYTFDNGNWTYSLRYPNSQSALSAFNDIPYVYGGTYTTSGGKITMTITRHAQLASNSYGIPQGLYTRDELEAAIRASEKGKTMSEEEIRRAVGNAATYNTTTNDYSLSGNTLTIRYDSSTVVYTRR
jgi:membrane-bound inhibitor of C-type lysozyme